MILKTLNKKSVAAAVALAVTAGVMTLAPETLNPISSAIAQEQAVQPSNLPDFSKLVEQTGKSVVSITVTKKARQAPRFREEQRREEPRYRDRDRDERGERDRGFGNRLPKDQEDLLRRFGFPFGAPFGELPPFDRPPQERAPRMPRRSGQGSGFIISTDGLILTNHHVVAGADEIKVHLTDNRTLTAKLLGSDDKTDIAVIKVDATDLPAVKFGKSSDVKVGEWVAAIGAPFGLENTVTQGIVSAMSRNLPDDQFVPFIQTDAAVNPGNSGGPLFNLKGEVIGINSQIFSTSGGFMGLSFAIPIDIALQIKDDLIKTGHVSRGRIGVVIQGITPELAKALGLKETEGALVAQVEKDSPAAKAGIHEGDVILSFDGTAIKDPRELSRLVASHKPGQSYDVKVLRDGKEMTLKVTIEEMKEATKAMEDAAPQKGRLGVVVRPLNVEETKEVGSGLVIVDVDEDSPAAEAGLQPNDIILTVGGKKITNYEEFRKIVNEAKGTIAIQVERNGQRTFVPVTFPEEKKDEKKEEKK